MSRFPLYHETGIAMPSITADRNRAYAETRRRRNAMIENPAVVKAPDLDSAALKRAELAESGVEGADDEVLFTKATRGEWLPENTLAGRRQRNLASRHKADYDVAAIRAAHDIVGHPFEGSWLRAGITEPISDDELSKRELRLSNVLGEPVRIKRDEFGVGRHGYHIGIRAAEPEDRIRERLGRMAAKDPVGFVERARAATGGFRDRTPSAPVKARAPEKWSLTASGMLVNPAGEMKDPGWTPETLEKVRAYHEATKGEPRRKDSIVTVDGVPHILSIDKDGNAVLRRPELGPGVTIAGQQWEVKTVSTPGGGSRTFMYLKSDPTNSAELEKMRVEPKVDPAKPLHQGVYWREGVPGLFTYNGVKDGKEDWSWVPFPKDLKTLSQEQRAALEAAKKDKYEVFHTRVDVLDAKGESLVKDGKRVTAERVTLVPLTPNGDFDTTRKAKTWDVESTSEQEAAPAAPSPADEEIPFTPDPAEDELTRYVENLKPMAMALKAAADAGDKKAAEQFRIVVLAAKARLSKGTNANP